MKTGFTLILVLITSVCWGQNDSIISPQIQSLDKKTIDAKFNLRKSTIYVINGVPYQQEDSIRIDRELKSYSPLHLIELTKLSNDISIGCRDADIVIIHYATQQSKKTIKKNLRKLKNSFTDKYYVFSQHILTNSKDPVLILNNKTVHHTESKKIFDSLKPSDVFFIDYKSESQAPEFYGQNAKNGFVRIWTKQTI